MAPWKTSTAGSARSTSTSSNRRQACLKAALRGGFLIFLPLPAQTRDIALHSSLQLRPTGFAIRSLDGVQFEIEKTNTDAMQYRAVWAEEAAFETRKGVRVCPRRMPASFHSPNAASQSSRKTKPTNQITPSLMVSKFYVFQQCVKEHAAERRPGNKKRATP